MSDKPNPNSADSKEEIEREIGSTASSRSTTLSGKRPGRFHEGAIAGHPERQAELEVEEYLRRHLVDRGGVLRIVMLRHLGESLVNADYDRPLASLAKYIRGLYVGPPPRGARPRSRRGVGTRAG